MAIMHQYNEPNRDFRHSGVLEAVKISILYLKGVLGLSGNRSSLKIAFGSASLAINKFHFFMYEICPFHPRFYFFPGMNWYNEQITCIMNISTMFIIRVNL